MAVTICLKIDGVEGESSIAKHEGEIDVLSWNWGMTQSASAHISTGAGSGSADVQGSDHHQVRRQGEPNSAQELLPWNNHKKPY
jgi:type VI protein secretion system component Hcp